MASPSQGHGFEQALGVSEGQGDLACCSPWGRRVRHEQLSNNIHYKAACILGLCEGETDTGGGCCDRTVSVVTRPSWRLSVYEAVPPRPQWNSHHFGQCLGDEGVDISTPYPAALFFLTRILKIRDLFVTNKIAQCRFPTQLDTRTSGRCAIQVSFWLQLLFPTELSVSLGAGLAVHPAQGVILSLMCAFGY